MGKMGSGKTTLADEIIRQKPEFVRYSFGRKVKEIAKDLFGMESKDRTLLQSLGTKMREIRDDVYVNYVIHECREHDYCLLDDARYVNEITRLRNNGWTLVKLDISPAAMPSLASEAYSLSIEEIISVKYEVVIKRNLLRRNLKRSYHSLLSKLPMKTI